MKRFAALLLALLVLLAAAPPAALAEGEETQVIASAEDFLTFAAGCAEESYSLGRVFELTQDLDLTGSGFEPVPYFAGTFLGNGHSIRGLEVTAAGSRMGLFRRTGPQAEINSLWVLGAVRPAGTAMQAGGIVGENAGSLISCGFEGSVEGIEDVGGIVGRNLAAGRVTSCLFLGTVRGEHQAGGIAGMNEGVLAGCENRGEINTVAITPRGEMRFDLSAIQQDDFVNLANVGGIAGESTGLLLNCKNTGPVGYKYNAYNVGGVAGKSSGCVQGCENSGAVTGRRDVGGVVGQLIPYAVWDFSDGKLDGLNSAIGGMQSLLWQMSQDAENLSGGISGELANMNAYTADALYALQGILGEYSLNDLKILENISINPATGELDFSGVDLSFPDTGALSAALANMQAETVYLSQLAGSATAVVAGDLTRVANQMSVIFSALNAAVGSVGGGLGETYDLSDSEAYDHDTGAIAECINLGSVDAENHAGGVVGTVAFEVAFDMEDRLDASQFLFSNARQYIFACVRACRSYGAVCVKEEGAGGIAGTADLGAVVNCVALGEARSLGGDCVGGVAGRSSGMVRGSWARSVLSGKKYVGGVAGLGTDLAANRSWTHIESGEEYRGAVAGWSDGAVTDNLYVPAGPAGVDGVSLVGQTQAIAADELLALEGAPQGFDRITLRFQAGDRMVKTLELPFGGSVDQLPQVPNKDGWYWKWDDFDREHVYYSRTVLGKYYSPNMTLSSGEEIPLFLAEGVFYEGQRLTVQEKAAPEGMRGAWTLRVNDYDGELTVRLYTPDGGSVLQVGEGGDLTPLASSRDGSYLVFRLPNGGTAALKESETLLTQRLPLWVLFGGAATLAAAGLAAVFILRRKKKKTAPAPEPPAADP